MKKIFTLVAAISFMGAGWAQSPQRLSYQAVVRDAGNALVATHAVGMRISILQSTSTGTAVYVETQTPTTNANGLVTIEVGGGTPVSGTFAAIDWSAGPYFIKTESDPAGGTTYTVSGTSQLLSVPYALYAKTTSDHFIGEKFGGGIVVSVWKIAGVQHGLIASLVDLSPAASWSTVINASSNALSSLDGQSNTTAILSQLATAAAAKLCNDYTITDATGTYSDWYLPAIWELKECYNAGYIVNTVLGATDGFKFAAYWSSTENSVSLAWYLLFNTGVIGSDAPKTNNGIVRAVRKF